MGPGYSLGSATMDHVQGRDEVNQWQKSVRALRPGNQEFQPPSEVRRNWMHQLQQGVWSHLHGPFLFFPPWPLNTSVAANHISEGRNPLLIYDCSMLVDRVIQKGRFNRHLASSLFDTLKQITRECATPQSQLWVVPARFYQTPWAQGDDRQAAWLFKCLSDPVSGKLCASSARESLGLPSASSSVLAEASTQTRRGSLCTQPCKPRWQAHLEAN